MSTGDLLCFTDGSNPGMTVQLEAQRNAGTGRWDIRQVTTFELTEGTAPDLNHRRQYKNIGTAKYDFDALRFLSEASAAKGNNGKKSDKFSLPKIFGTLNGRQREMPHWRVAAKAARQPVDDHGVVQPLVDGQLLADNIFFDDPEQIRLVEESKPKIITVPTPKIEKPRQEKQTPHLPKKRKFLLLPYRHKKLRA